MPPIRGIVVRSDADAETLIVRATPADVAQFTQQPVPVNVFRGGSAAATLPKPGDTLYDARGVAVVIIEELHVSRHMIDVTSYKSSHQQWAAGAISSSQVSGRLLIEF